MFAPPKQEQVRVTPVLSPPLGEVFVDDYVRNFNWRDTPLGPIDKWPSTLSLTYNLWKHSLFPINIYWGPHFITLFNQVKRFPQTQTPYLLLLPRKSRANDFRTQAWRNQVMAQKKIGESLGIPGPKVWPEAWPVLAPMIESVRETRKPVNVSDHPMILYRSGYWEECYFSWSFEPILNPDRTVGGFLSPLQETTHKVLGSRRLRTLSDLGANTPNAKSPQEVRSALNLLIN